MLELAYIDPGSGSLIIQAVIATLVAVPLFFREHLARAFRVVRGRRSAAGPTPSTDDEPPGS